jgi:hypothetical protein
MFLAPRSLRKSVIAGLTVLAVAPAAAGAVPAIDGQGVAAGGGPGVSASDFPSQNLTAPDQVDRGSSAQAPLPGPPTWPSNPRVVHHTTVAKPSDDGIDTSGWVAIGGGALVLISGLGLLGASRIRTGREQPA